MLRTLKQGDILYLAALDRLGRNYAEIQDFWRILTKEMGVDIIILDMPLLNTTTHKDLMGTLISDIVLQLLSYVATVERANLLRRQAEGIAAAHARGVKFGRPPKPRPAEFANIRASWVNNELSAREAARTLGITHRTFLFWARET
jgi:DNA invertase Pin-like site-specific DNA recombinase